MIDEYYEIHEDHYESLHGKRFLSLKSKLLNAGLYPNKFFILRDNPKQLSEAIDYFNEHAVAKIAGPISHQEWDEFCNKTNKVGVVSLEDIPSTWDIPSRLRVIRNYMNMSWLDFAKLDNKLEDREASHFSHKSFIAVDKSKDTVQVIQSINNMKLSDNFLLKDIEKNFRDGHYTKSYEDYPAHIDKVQNKMAKCDMDLVVSGHSSILTEKDFYGVVCGVPSCRLYSNNIRHLMAYYGFKCNYIESLQWLKEFDKYDNTARQKWQNSQAQDLEHNRKILQKLAKIINDIFEEDINKI